MAPRLTCRAGGPPGGRPVLLLHPWFGCARFWEPALPALDGARWLAADLYSPARGDWAGVAAPGPLAEAVADLLDGPADVVGCSMGGILAMLLAAGRPELVRRLVVVGTGATSVGLHSAFAEWLAAPGPAGLEPLTRGLVASRAARHPLVDACVAELAAVDPAYVAAVPRATLGLDLRPRLARIAAPALVVRGELDAIRTAAHVRELAAGIPGARAVELPGAGHAPMVDSPALFNRMLRDFLAA
jgi:3-oxoadipate enol-lactonase